MNARQTKTQIITALDPLNAQSKISSTAPYYPNLSGYLIVYLQILDVSSD